MKTLAYELKQAVKKGKQIKETYSDMIESTIRIAKAMKYPGASNVKKEDIVASIKDINCHAWRQHLQGKQTMGPNDLAPGDDEEQPNYDLVIQGPMLGKEETEAAAEAIEKLPKMLVADTKKKMRKLFDNITKAHQHAAEASRTLRELHDDLPLNVFLRIADCAVRPLVILHIPKTEATIQRLKEAAVESMQRMVGSTNITDVMIQKNLPKCGEWTTEDEYKPRKMIASLVYKYVRNVMFKEQTATKFVVDEFKLPKTTIHRQIYGKKYPGGGQKLEKMRLAETSSSMKASGSGIKRIAAVILKRTKEAEEMSKEKIEVEKDGKGKGAGKSSKKKRTAADIRSESTAENEKQKCKDKKAAEKALEEEDPDLPTKDRDSGLQTRKETTNDTHVK